jgi:hypothetical protein
MSTQEKRLLLLHTVLAGEQEMLNTVGSVALLAEGRDLKYVRVSSVKKVFKNYVKSDLF